MKLIIIAAAVIVTTAAAISLIIIRNRMSAKYIRKPDFYGHDTVPPDLYVRTGEYTELIGVFDDRQSAEEAATLYDIELYSFEGAVAVFHVPNNRDIEAMLEGGKQKGWPELSYNYYRELYDKGNKEVRREN